MARTTHYKLLIVGLTVVICGALLWWQPLCGEPPDEGFRRGDAATSDGGNAGTLAAGDGGLLDPAAIVGTVLDETAAKALFRGVREGKRQMYDPLAYAVLKPDVTETWPWPEHPDGKITSRTNNLGFREDAPTQVEKHGLRILVCGDSHTDGMVNNAESFANVLEELLDVSWTTVPDHPRVEVLNAGVGNTGPHNYVGTLKRNLHLQPDLVIVALYTGNDFLNALALSDFFTKRPESKPAGRVGEAYQRQMLEAYKTLGAVVVDRFNQALKFSRFPEDGELALSVAVGCFEELAAICRERGIGLLAVILPTKPDADLADDRDTFEQTLATCGLTAEQYGINARLGARFAEALRARGIAVLDATAAFQADPTPHYWRKDWHLNVAGHALLARLLLPEVTERLPPR
jgi:hypothetical protein